MDIKGQLEARSRDEIVELGAQLVFADDHLLWSLIQARKDAGYSQREFAELLGIKQSTLSKFESPDSDPRLSTIRRYARTIGATVLHQVTTFEGERSVSPGWSMAMTPVVTYGESQDREISVPAPDFGETSVA